MNNKTIQYKKIKFLAILLCLLLSFFCIFKTINKVEASTVQYSGTCGTCSWEIDANGLLRIFPTDGIYGLLTNGNSNQSFPWNDSSYCITKVIVENGVASNVNVDYLFYQLNSCKEIDLSGLDTRKTKTLDYMIYRCTSLSILNLDFDTRYITSGDNMFEGSVSSLSTIKFGENFKFPNSTEFYVYGSTYNDNWVKVYNIDGTKTNDTKKYKASQLVNFNNTTTPTLAGTWSKYGVLDGDETTTLYSGTCGDCSWKIDGSGTLNIYPTNGTFGTLADNTNSSSSFWPWSAYKNAITGIIIGEGVAGNSNISYIFAGYINLTILDLSNFDTSNVKNMNNMFSGCSNLISIDLSNFKTNATTAMKSMFYNCSNLKTLDLSNFDTGNVENMENLFYGCNRLTALDVSNFTTSSVKTMRSMFYKCNSLTSLNLSNFITTNVTDMSYMFYYCRSLIDLNISSFNTTNVTNMYHMFYYCDSLVNFNLSNFATDNVTNMSYMFSNCDSLINLNLSSFNTTNVTNMSSIFSKCTSLKTIKFGENFIFKGSSTYFKDTGDNWVKTYNVDGTLSNDMTEYTADEITSLNNTTTPTLAGTWNRFGVEEGGIITGVCGGCSWEIDYNGQLRIYPTDGVSGILDNIQLNTSNVSTAPWYNYRTLINKVIIEDGVCTNSFSSYVFQNLSKCIEMDLSGLDTSTSTSMAGMFEGCKSLRSLDLSQFNTSKVTSMTQMFYDCKVLTKLTFGDGFKTSEVTSMAGMFRECNSLTDLDVSKFNTDKVTNMDNMFNNCYGLISLDFTNWNTSQISSMKYMFSNCESLIALDLSNFNTSKVTDMNQLFKNCTNLLELKTGDAFNTENVTTMAEMFANCYNLTNLDLNIFDTSKVASMKNMFKNCYHLVSLNIENFNTTKVSTMGGMFYNCQSLINLDLSKWQTNNLTEMVYYQSGFYSMFGNCKSLVSLNVENFDTSQISDMSNMFYNCNNLTNLDLSNFDTNNVTDMRYMFYQCNNLTSLDISGFNTSKTTYMNDMFYGCNKLTCLDLNNFDTSSATNMSEMFRDCNELTSLNLSTFNTSNVTNMWYMFSNCSKLNKIVFGEQFTFVGTDHNFSNTGNNWVKTRNADASKTYDKTEYTGAQVATLNNIASTPSLAGTWVKYGIESEYIVNEDGSVEYISIDSDWVMLSDDVWVYSFSVFDDSLIYHLYEEIIDGYSSAAMNPSYITVHDGAATITNTADDIETEKLVVTKTISGIETDEEFEFTITLTGENILDKQIFNDVIFIEGIGKFYLGHGEQKTFDLPIGTSFSIDETTNLNYASVITPATGTILKDQPITINAVNTYIENPVIEPEENSVNITIKKTAENLNVDSDGSMLFTINGYFTGLKASEMYIMSNSNTITSDKNGNAYCNISIEAGQEVIIYNIPEGATYQFTEQAGAYISSYTLVNKGTEGTGTIIKENCENSDKNKALSTAKEVADKNEEIVITFHNIFDSVQNLTINKVVKEEQEDGSLVVISDCDDNFEFTINFSNMNKDTMFTSTIGKIIADENGEASKTFYLQNGQSVNFYDIPDGVRYQIIETENDYLATYAIEGTEVVSSSHESDKSNKSLSTEIEIVNKNENGVVTFTNIKENNPEMDVIILKTDNENNLLEGAILQVKDENGEVLEEWTSTTEQHIVALREGTYTLHEKQAPTGYCVAKDIEFTVTKDSENKVVMVDVPLSMMVSSGGNGTIIAVIIAAACACIACVCIYVGKKKSKAYDLE